MIGRQMLKYQSVTRTQRVHVAASNNNGDRIGNKHCTRPVYMINDCTRIHPFPVAATLVAMSFALHKCPIKQRSFCAENGIDIVQYIRYFQIIYRLERTLVCKDKRVSPAVAFTVLFLLVTEHQERVANGTLNHKEAKKNIKSIRNRRLTVTAMSYIRFMAAVDALRAKDMFVNLL